MLLAATLLFLPFAACWQSNIHSPAPSWRRAAPGGRSSKVSAIDKIDPEDWTAAFATQQEEFSNIALSGSGILPADLLGGTFYKNGPACFSRGESEYEHWLDGDGYVTALRFSRAGEALWSGRYVRTDAYEAETAEGELLYRTTFGTQKPGGWSANAMDIRLKSPANTAIVPLPGTDRLLALWEAGPPYELDASLACRGANSLDGRLSLSPEHGALPATTGLPPVDAFLESTGWCARWHRTSTVRCGRLALPAVRRCLPAAS